MQHSSQKSLPRNLYDIETYKDVFIVCYQEMESDDPDTIHTLVFLDSMTRGQIADNMAILKRRFCNGAMTIGYNNSSFDDIVINYVLKARWKTILEIHLFANKVIEYHNYNNGRNEGAYRAIKPYKYTNFVSVDLMRVLYSKKLRVSLKAIQVTLNMPNVEESPIRFDEEVGSENIEPCIYYCHNDIKSTRQLYERLRPNLNLRREIKREFGITKAFLLDDVNLGMELLLSLYTRQSGKTRDSIESSVEREPHMIEFSTILSPKINLKTEPFMKARQWFEQIKVWSDTKPEKHIEFVAYNCVFSCGLGGLHTLDRPAILESDSDTVIVDIDVASLYPNLYKVLAFEIPQIPGFTQLYVDLISKRLEAKRSGNKLVADTYKLSLNGFYGNLNNQYSWAYYPTGTYSITMNGQLFILMLIERLLGIGCELVSANTDGVTYRVRRDMLEASREVYRGWEADTGLELEEAVYEKIIRRDINNYLAITDKGKIKTKGVFDTTISIGKGYDKPIVMDAVIAKLLHDTPIKDTIRGCRDITKFIMYEKVDKKFEVYHNGEGMNNINRFYASTNGENLYKVNPNGKKISLLASSRATVCNKLPESFPDNVNYGYYIDEAIKELETLSPSQLKLF